MGVVPRLGPQRVVIFGASGDLTKRKLLPAFYELFAKGLLPEDFAVVGYSGPRRRARSSRRVRVGSLPR